MNSMESPARMALKRIKSLLSDRSGNFGIMTALMLPCLAGAAGLAIDVSSALATKNQMASAADAGALAAAAALADKKTDVAGAKLLASEFVMSQVASLGMSSDGFEAAVDVKTTTSGTKNKYDVTVQVDGSMSTSLTQIFGYRSVPISVASFASSATGSQNSMSMYLVLDRSGSMLASVTTSVKSLTKGCDYNYMNLQQTALYTKNNQRPCYYQRMEILKDAVGDLMDSLAKADTEKKYIRTGAAAYSSEMFKPTNLSWGTVDVKDAVNEMYAEGGTSSTDAFTEAVVSLTKQSENSAHKAKNGLEPNKYIVFMTDGENNSSRDNSDTLAQCAKAKREGITVYTVGFMLASTTAKNLLLNCASSARTYFDAQDGDRLASAFADIARQTAGTNPLLTQ